MFAYVICLLIVAACYYGLLRLERPHDAAVPTHPMASLAPCGR
jgi:hypothetical protein